MASIRNRDLLFLTCAVYVTRTAFRSHALYDLDSVNFALAMERFDPHVHQPHPPGYFLYVWLGRLLNLVFHDANAALVGLSILASCGLGIVIYRMASEWFGVEAARFAGLLFLFSPLAWFHGIVALTYIVEAFFSALVGYLCWQVECGDRNFILAAACTLGICAGVRPSSLLFLGPLYLYSLRHASPKQRGISVAALAATLGSWFVPMIAASGGLTAYFSALFSLWQMVPAKATVFNSSFTNSIARALTIVLIYVLCFGAAALAPLGARLSPATSDSQKKVFTLVWMAPALLFFTFIFLKFVNSGYLLLLMAPACLWMGFWTSEWFRNGSWRRSSKLAAIGACAAANVALFLFSPFYCSYRSVRNFEAELRSVQSVLPQLAPAKNTLIIGFDSHFLGYRHAGYYLPAYLTMEYPAAKLREGTRIFAMQGRDTSLLEGLPPASYSRFVLFPLPGEGVSYRAYLQKVLAPLPPSGLHQVHIEGHDFVTGPISDLPLLFPGMNGPGMNGLRESFGVGQASVMNEPR